MTPREAVAGALPALRQTVGADAAACARWLMMEALGVDLTGYALRSGEPMTAEAQARFDAMAARCAAGEPVQYILGRWDFAGLTLKTDRRALIPRPETELAAAKAAELAGGRPGVSVMDIGCGTGCIGLYVASRCPGARVTLCDVSPGALALARENAALLGLTPSIVEADMACPLPGGPYDILASNPPYIARGELKALEPGVRQYEPLLALDGGEDGLAAYRLLARRAVDSLRPGGWMVLEVGAGQSVAVDGLLRSHCDDITVIPDDKDIPRVVTARRKNIG